MKSTRWLLALTALLFVGCAATPQVTQRVDVASIRKANNETIKQISSNQKSVSTIQQKLKSAKQHEDASQSDLEAVGKDLDKLLKQ